MTEVIAFLTSLFLVIMAMAVLIVVSNNAGKEKKWLQRIVAITLFNLVVGSPPCRGLLLQIYTFLKFIDLFSGAGGFSLRTEA